MRYTITTASKVAGLNPGTARSWLQNDWLTLSRKDIPANSPGATTLLSYNRVLLMAVSAKLVEMGMHPELACKAARSFTDFSNPLEAPGYNRNPGELFEGRKIWTVLFAYVDGSSQVARVDSATPLQDIFFPTGAAGMTGSRKEAAYVVMLDFIVKHVKTELERFQKGSVI